MPNYDEIVLGVGNSQHPANQKEIDINGYEELAHNLHKEKMKFLTELLKAENKLNEIKELCEGMSENNGLAILILNKLK